MKKIALLLALSMSAASLSGCGFIDEFKKSYKEALKESIKEEIAAELDSSAESEYHTEDFSDEEFSSNYNDEENSYDDSESSSSSDTTLCTVGNISFEVKSDWEHIDIDGFEGSFKEDGGKAVYQLQGASQLGSFEPQSFFDYLVDYYAESHEVTYSDDTLSNHTAPDGTDCLVGRIELKKDKVIFYIDVLIAEDKNTVLTFSSQCSEINKPATDIRDVTESACFNIGTEDMLSGRRFTTSNDTAMYLEDDGTFRYCESASDPDNAYYSGTYEVYRGQDAIDKLASMTDYGLTEEELETTLDANMNGYSIGGSKPYDYFDENSSDEGYHICKDTFYALVMDTDMLFENGEESSADASVLYFGYYVEELGIFDLLNANSVSYSQWTEIE